MLLEREREMAEYDAALSEVGHGKGCAMAIEANAGLGKTRLLQEAQRAAGEAGLTVLTCRGTELEREFPFALMRQMLQAHLAGLPAQEREALLEGAGAARGALGLKPDAEGSPDSFAVLHGLYWVTAALADRSPLLLSVDDVHWADSSSLDYLDFLLPRIEELPVMLVMTSRPDEPEAAASLERILADDSVRRQSPSPLSAAATATLLAHGLGQDPAPDFERVCHEVSGGNPFLLSELVHTLAEQEIEPAGEQAELVRRLAPERVGRSVLLRIAGLSPEAATVARSLAILGDDSEPDLTARLSQLDSETTRSAADELRAASIFEDHAKMRFVHPLVRNAVYREMPAGERARAHDAAAALLRARDASSERVATQLLSSDPEGERASVEILIDAGEHALAAGAPRSAVAYLRRAMAEPPPPDLRSAVLDPLLTASFRTVDPSLLKTIEPDVLAEWRRAPSLRSRWAVKLTMLMALEGRFEEASSLLREATETAISEGDVEREYQFKAQQSTLVSLVHSLPDVEIGDNARLVEPDSPTGRLAAAIEARSLTFTGTAREAADAARRALGNDGIIFDEEPELIAAGVAVMLLVGADEVEEARRGAQSALRIALRRNATPDLARARFLNGFVSWGIGDLAAAEADMRQAVELARLAGIAPFVLMFTGPLMEVLIERDELDAAEAALTATGFALGPMPAGAMFGVLLTIRSHLRFEQRRLDEVGEDLETLSAHARSPRVGPGPILTVAPFAVRTLIAAGEADKARKLADEMMVEAERWGAPATVAHVLRASAGARKQGERVELFQRAVNLLERSPRHLVRAQALVDLGAALRRDGREEEARVPLREGYSLARRCGAARVAKRAHRELTAGGENVRGYVPIGVESLTSSERRVAELAAEGMTNRQIAQSLFVTIKTVEAHLSAAYHKLDIENRRQLPRAMETDSEGRGLGF